MGERPSQLGWFADWEADWQMLSEEGRRESQWADDPKAQVDTELENVQANTQGEY